MPGIARPPRMSTPMRQARAGGSICWYYDIPCSAERMFNIDIASWLILSRTFSTVAGCCYGHSLSDSWWRRTERLRGKPRLPTPETQFLFASLRVPTFAFASPYNQAIRRRLIVSPPRCSAQRRSVVPTPRTTNGLVYALSFFTHGLFSSFTCILDRSLTAASFTSLLPLLSIDAPLTAPSLLPIPL